MENFKGNYEGAFNIALYFYMPKSQRDATLVYSWVLPGLPSDTGWKIRDVDKGYKVIFGSFDVKNILQLWESLLLGEELSVAAAKAKISLKNNTPSRISDWIFPRAKYIRRPQCIYQAKDEWGGDGEGFYSPTKSSISRVESFFCLNKEEFLGDWYTYLSHCEVLKSETGIDFSKKQAGRIGNIEWYEIPASNIYEKPCISIRMIGSETERKISGKDVRVTIEAGNSGKYLVNIRCTNGAAIVCDAIKNISIPEAGGSIDFRASEEISGTEVKVWKEVLGDWLLFHDKQVYWIRSIHSRMVISTGNAIIEPKKLNKAASARPELIKRIDALKKIGLYSGESASIISEDKHDPWRLVASDFPKKIEKYNPIKSESMFLPKGWQGSIEFYEWLQSLPKKAEDTEELIIVDPYIDDEVIGFIPRFGNTNLIYTLVTNTAASKDPGARKQALTKAASLLHSKIQMLNFKIYDVVKEKQLIHDRYIILKSNDGFFDKGWHLSNSIQKANENFPLLITSIPRDVLHEIQDWLSGELNSGAELEIIWSSLANASTKNLANEIYSSSIYEEISTQEIKELLPAEWECICLNGYNNNATAENIISATQELDSEIWRSIGDSVSKRLASGTYYLGEERIRSMSMDWRNSEKFSELLDCAERFFNYLPPAHHVPPDVYFLVSAAIKNNENFLLGFSSELFKLCLADDALAVKFSQYFHKLFSTITFELTLSGRDEEIYLSSEIDLIVGLGACSLLNKIQESIMSPEMAIAKIEHLGDEKVSEIILKWIYNLRVLDNRQNEGVEKRASIRNSLFRKLAEVWPPNATSEYIKYVLIRCGGPGHGNWAGLTTNELFLPLFQSNKVAISEFWVAVNDLVKYHLKDRYFSRSEMGAVFETFAWACVNIEAILLDNYLRELDDVIRRDIRILERPFSASISHDSFLESLERIHKILSVLLRVSRYGAPESTDKRVRLIIDRLRNASLLSSTSSEDLNDEINDLIETLC